jgi:hypothetical protein
MPFCSVPRAVSPSSFLSQYLTDSLSTAPQGSLSGKKNNSLSSAPYRGSEYVGGQSSIWSLNCSTLSFTPTWINSDGANDAIQAFYTSTFTGDNGKPSGTGYYGVSRLFAVGEDGY